jgi:hypothetical protein
MRIRNMQDYLFFFIYLFVLFGLSTELPVMFDFVLFLFNHCRREMISISQLRYYASESINQLYD